MNPPIDPIAAPESEPENPPENLTPRLDPLNTPLPNNAESEALKKSQYFNNSIFWIELEKIVPNPYQPRKEFDQHALRDLADSIRMYGLLQPLVVTRVEIIKEDGGLATRYELISGERRWRACRLAGLSQAPVIIRAQEEDARVKLELAIIENLQREDLNAIDRARSFQRLADEFGLKHHEIALKMGKSREYVTNSIRLLALPEHMLQALSEKRISEGHTRPLLMLADRPQEQEVLFKEITSRKMTVREAERAARVVAVERARKQDPHPEYTALEKQFNEALGTRVFIEKKEQGGKLVIDFFNIDDVRALLDRLSSEHHGGGMPGQSTAHAHSTPQVHPNVGDIHAHHAEADSQAEQMSALTEATGLETVMPVASASAAEDVAAGVEVPEATQPVDDSSPADKAEDEGLYSVSGFTI
jgi:ParB family chromosome partitioning protein